MRTGLISLVIFLTGVLIALAPFESAGRGQQGSPFKTPAPPRQTKPEDVVIPGYPVAPTKAQELRECMQAMTGATEAEKEKKCISLIGGGNVPDDCREATTKFNQARSDFMSSCGEGSLDACLRTAYSCSTCKGKRQADYCPGADVAKDARKRQNEARIQGQVTSSESTSTIGNIASCPQVALQNVEELRKQLDKHTDQKEKGEDRIAELMEEIREAESKMKEAESEFQSTIEELGGELEEQEKKIKKNTTEEMNAKRDMYNKLNDEITKLTLKIQEINAQKVEGIGAAERECHNFALQQLDTYLKDRRAALNSAQLSSGSISKLFSSTGPNRKEKNATVAKKYFSSCMRDRNHLDKIDSIKRAHALGLEQIVTTIDSIRKQQLSLIQEISGDPAQKEFKEQIEGIYKMHNRAVQKETKKYQTLVQRETNRIQSLQQKLQLEQRRLAEVQADMTHKEAVYGMADEVAGGRGKDDPGSKFVEKFGVFATDSAATFGACCSAGADSKDPICKDAKEVMCVTGGGVSGDECDTKIATIRRQLKEQRRSLRGVKSRK